ncbi:MAG: type IV secretory system conjugative DNA transfer family protein [Alphaproteobacteria bacterium]|nr:type IV secretory system conjugative DNA transfer family protein [Alphaproteobacteria bacterium]
MLLHQGSAFIVDPKGENALVTALRRGQGSSKDNIPGMGQKVLLLDPWDIAASKLGLPQASFNPLDWIKEGDPDAAENAFLLADALVVPENASRERFWDDEAKALLTGIILYVGTAEEESEDRTLGRVRDILNLDDNKFKDLLTKMYQHPHPIVRSTAARQASKSTKLFSSVLAVTQAHTHFLDSERIRESLAKSDFSFEDLKNTPTSVYLILPADRLNTFDRWLRLLIQQAITINARNIEQRTSRPILFLLDEMSALGRLPALEQAYSLMAGFGMQLWGIVQDLSQLARVYGEHGWQTFISNSGVIQYFGSRDKMTAEYFSSLCGVTTVETKNFSWVIGQAISYATSVTSSWGSGGSSTSSNTSSSSWSRSTGVNEAQRHLAYPDELMVLKRNEQIVFVENLDPIPGQKVTWYDHASLKSLGVNLLSTKG